jgi:hypothetical protein
MVSGISDSDHRVFAVARASQSQTGKRISTGVPAGCYCFSSGSHRLKAGFPFRERRTAYPKADEHLVAVVQLWTRCAAVREGVIAARLPNRHFLAS